VPAPNKVTGETVQPTLRPHRTGLNTPVKPLSIILRGGPEGRKLSTTKVKSSQTWTQHSQLRLSSWSTNICSPNRAHCIRQLLEDVALLTTLAPGYLFGFFFHSCAITAHFLFGSCFLLLLLVESVCERPKEDPAFFELFFFSPWGFFVPEYG
jgi:hypothetical protein